MDRTEAALPVSLECSSSCIEFLLMLDWLSSHTGGRGVEGRGEGEHSEVLLRFVHRHLFLTITISAGISVSVSVINEQGKENSISKVPCI